MQTIKQFLPDTRPQFRHAEEQPFVPTDQPAPVVMFPTFESFCQVMDQCTENYECLVINNNAKSNKLTDQIFWYKAEPHPTFKLGSKEFWDLSKQLPSDDEDESYDPKATGKKNVVKINVKKATTLW